MSSDWKSSRDEIHRRLASALESYKATLFDINLDQLRQAVSDTRVEFDELAQEQDQDERQEQELDFLISEYFSPEAVAPEDIKQIDGLTLDNVADPSIARRILPVGVDYKTSRPEGTDALLQGLQDKITAQAGEEIHLPDEYSVLASLVFLIQPPGLPATIGPIGAYLVTTATNMEVPALQELIERLHTAKRGYTTYAGFVSDPHAPGKEGTAFAWILCERGEGANQKERRKRWRIAYAQHDFGPLMFEDVEEFLRWFARYHLPGWEYWNEELGRYDED